MPCLTLGSYTLEPIVEIADFRVPLSKMFPDAAREPVDWPTWIDASSLVNGHVRLVIRSWLIRGEGRTILVDTCVGAGKERAAWPAWHRRDATWLHTLAAHNCQPEDVDIVLCTHLHADHVGWNTTNERGRWVPTFPRARTLASHAEYDFAVQSVDGRHYGAFQDSVAPLMGAGLIDLVDDGYDLAPGLTLRLTPGHSPGHLSLELRRGQGALLCGDVIHTMLQLHRPDWSPVFDHSPGQARATRRRVLTEVAEQDIWFVPAHFPAPGFAKIASDGLTFRPA